MLASPIVIARKKGERKKKKRERGLVSAGAAEKERVANSSGHGKKKKGVSVCQDARQANLKRGKCFAPLCFRGEGKKKGERKACGPCWALPVAEKKGGFFVSPSSERGKTTKSL